MDDVFKHGHGVGEDEDGVTLSPEDGPEALREGLRKVTKAIRRAIRTLSIHDRRDVLRKLVTEAEPPVYLGGVTMAGLGDGTLEPPREDEEPEDWTQRVFGDTTESIAASRSEGRAVYLRVAGRVDLAPEDLEARAAAAVETLHSLSDRDLLAFALYVGAEQFAMDNMLGLAIYEHMCRVLERGRPGKDGEDASA